MKHIAILSKSLRWVPAMILLASPALGSTCYVAKPGVGADPITGSAMFVLNDAETELTYNVACCACGSVQTAVISAIGGQVHWFMTLNGCPVKGTWTSTDLFPLSPDIVNALKNGTLRLEIAAPTCQPGAVSRYFTLVSCGE